MSLEENVLHDELVSILDELFRDCWDNLDKAAQDFVADRLDDVELGVGFSKDDAAALIQMARDHGIRK